MEKQWSLESFGTDGTPVEFVIAQVRKRQEAEDEFYANLADDEGP